LNAVSWEWDFGNGTTSVNQDDSAIYAAAGVYQVKLGVWNEDGIKDSIVKTVTVY
jgi:PKD repeat protein